MTAEARPAGGGGGGGGRKVLLEGDGVPPLLWLQARTQTDLEREEASVVGWSAGPWAKNSLSHSAESYGLGTVHGPTVYEHRVLTRAL